MRVEGPVLSEPKRVEGKPEGKINLPPLLELCRTLYLHPPSGRVEPQRGEGLSIVVRALIASLRYKPDAQARESSKAVAHPSLARRACVHSLLAFRNVTIKAVVRPSRLQ